MHLAHIQIGYEGHRALVLSVDKRNNFHDFTEKVGDFGNPYKVRIHLTIVLKVGHSFIYSSVRAANIHYCEVADTD